VDEGGSSGAVKKKSLPWPFGAERSGANLTLTLKRSERERGAAVCIAHVCSGVKGGGAGAGARAEGVNSETSKRHSP